MNKLFRRLQGPIVGLLGTFPAGTTLMDAVGVTAFLGGTFASSSLAIARHAELQAGDDWNLLGSIR